MTKFNPLLLQAAVQNASFLLLLHQKIMLNKLILVVYIIKSIMKDFRDWKETSK